MVRAILLAIGKEFRLLRRDPVGLFMLVVAPIAVIAAAGFSLSNVYGGGSASYTLAVVDEDRGAIASAILDALRADRSLVVLETENRDAAKAMVRQRKEALLAIVIPASTTRSFEAGSSPSLIVYGDPVRYLETVRVELALAELVRRINTKANDETRRALADSMKQLDERLSTAARSAAEADEAYRRFVESAERARTTAEARLRAQLEEGVERARAQTIAAIDRAIARISSEISGRTAEEKRLLEEAGDYSRRLEQTRAAFEQWFARLKSIAGSHASDIPPPPAFPEPPRDLAKAGGLAAEPPDFAALRAELDKSIATPDINLKLPEVVMPRPPASPVSLMPPRSAAAMVPGTLGFVEQDLDGSAGGDGGGFNAFNLQVPGFAVTFLLIGMLMGVSLALIDEHDWGTLDRLRAAAAPLGATFAGKLLARFAIGFVQMAVLFAAGRAMFGISLGRAPWALMMPSASIAFAGAAFGLVVAGIGRTRDAVLPVGAIVIMTMAAIGGCWWPIDFEPRWMQAAALAVPTTWAMRAYNDLMIRGLSPASALVPSAVNLMFGILYMAVGIPISRRRFAP